MRTEMKNLTKVLAVIALSAASFTTLAAATAVSSQPNGEHKIGEVSASTNSDDLSALQRNLASEASEEGARSYHITSAGGENHLYGTAEIYK
jgi:multiple stress resistance protein BhsA